LFTDVLVYTSLILTKGVKKYNFHRMLPLNDMRVEDLLDARNSIQIFSMSKSFVVFTDSEYEKDLWLYDLNRVIEYNKTGQWAEITTDKNPNKVFSLEAPIWVPDADVDKCMICSSSFTMIRRKHHCRNCGKAVCSNCSSNKIYMPNISRNILRACDNCYEESINPKLN